MKKAHGFTMLETLIAGVIGIVVLGAATIAVLAITNTLNLQKARAGLDEESKLLADYLMAKIQSAGNEYIRPWAVVYAHDEGSSRISHQIDEDQRSDAITIGQPLGQDMTVETWNWTLGNKSIDVTAKATKVCGQCPSYEGKHVVIYNSTQTAYYPAYITKQESSVVTSGECNGDTANDKTVVVRCRYDLEPSKAGAKPINSHLIYGVNSDLLSMQEVTFETYYLVIRELFKIHQLWGYKDHNNNGRPDATNDERFTLANDVYDLQISMGYDYAPQDRRLPDYESSDDEWFNNSVNDCDAIVESATDFNNDGYLVPTGAQPKQLRMAAIGITVGKRIRGIGRDKKFSFVQHFNGACLNPYGYHLRGTKSRAMLRSLNLYEP